eukprot:3726133-Rhodomonas_salina.1
MLSPRYNLCGTDIAYRATEGAEWKGFVGTSRRNQTQKRQSPYKHGVVPGGWPGRGWCGAHAGAPGSSIGYVSIGHGVAGA